MPMLLLISEEWIDKHESSCVSVILVSQAMDNIHIEYTSIICDDENSWSANISHPNTCPKPCTMKFKRQYVDQYTSIDGFIDFHMSIFVHVWPYYSMKRIHMSITLSTISISIFHSLAMAFKVSIHLKKCIVSRARDSKKRAMSMSLDILNLQYPSLVVYNQGHTITSWSIH
jgi:hypothetical protein